MSAVAERIYQLLPAVYRRRDAEQNGELQDLIAVISEQVELLEENLEQSYDDHFVETCAEWVLPYIGDLIGYRTLHGVVPEVASQRRELANTVRARRRKGTASMLEQLARDVTGWNARVVEYFELLITQQYMNHLREHNRTTVNMRDWEALERVETAFDSVPHSLNVRRISLGAGKHNVPNIGIFLWRLNAYPLSNSPAVAVAANRFMFSPLGNDMQLFCRPESESEITHIAEPINVPEPISRRVLDARLPLYYGEGKSFSLFDDGTEIPIARIIVCDLSDDGLGNWAHEPTASIAVDPVLGRIAFPPLMPPEGELRVNFHYGFSADISGGEYERRSSFEQDTVLLEEVDDSGSIQAALDNANQTGSVQINGSGRHVENLSVQLSASQLLELRTANGSRPGIFLNSDLTVEGDENSELVINGLLIAGAAITIPADSQIRKLTLRHCALVPGLSLSQTGESSQPLSPSLRIENSNVTVVIEQCVLGPIESARGANIEISDSVVDAMSPESMAIGALQGTPELWGGSLELLNSTVIGQVSVSTMPLVSNSIFHAETAVPADRPVDVLNKQSGCVRFSFVPPGSVVPRRYRCQPDLAAREAIDELEKQSNTELTEAERETVRAGIYARILPVFTDLRYSQPAYAQLQQACPIEIKTGADDESEMGVFHHLYQAQRETNLTIRLDEYLRFGLEAGIYYET